MPILVVVRDLMFVGRIVAEARARNAEIKVVRDPATLSRETEKRAIVDLNLDGAIAAAKEWKDRTGGEIVGFVSHADANAIQQARDAGFDQIMARSAFVNVLGDLLSDNG